MSKATPFSRLLIANRGEVACRIMRTAHAMGYGTVAIFSEADRAAPYVREADCAVPVGGPLPAESYLNIPAIIEAARRSGADAVHPGYGFLAENPDFARACGKAGLAFVGPSVEAISVMGDKARAKRKVATAGVPCIPGYAGTDQSDSRLRKEAERIGFPVMIKAVAGGGGRGMRLVETVQAFEDCLRAARAEAQGAFGDSRVLLEKAIHTPRHVEVQVVADRYGHAVHFGERDCSIQRRHQKLIEETPSPAVMPALRKKMGDAALSVVRTLHYEGAGTIEFLVDDSGAFYFMEMNTRLQVEHPITEAVTGLDIVALQLDIAAGEPLPVAQNDIRFEGHAMEVRLCAEDPAQNFVPQSGRLERWRVPAGVRVDHAMEEGAEILPFYDSMISKVITHGRTREEARRKLVRALEKLVALGVMTNQGFLLHCLKHPDFVAGRATTAFVEQNGDGVPMRDAGYEKQAIAIAAILLYLTGAGSGCSPVSRRLPRWLDVMMRLRIGEDEYPACLTFAGDDACVVTVDGGEVRLSHLAITTAGILRFDCKGVAETVDFHRHEDELWLCFRGWPLHAIDLSLRASVVGGADNNDGIVRAAMGGRVTAVLTSAGASVSAGQPLVTVEAMKMEHVHVASVMGVVKTVHVSPGQQISARDPVVEVVPAMDDKLR